MDVILFFAPMLCATGAAVLLGVAMIARDYR